MSQATLAQKALRDALLRADYGRQQAWRLSRGRVRPWPANVMALEERYGIPRSIWLADDPASAYLAHITRGRASDDGPHAALEQ